MTNEHVELLKRSVILGVLSEAELMEVSRQVTVRQYSPGEIIIRAGDPADGLYVVSDGLVTITVGEQQSSATQVPLGVFGPGQVFGEMALFDQSPRSATATATIDCTCLFVPAATFSGALERNPAIAVALLPLLAQRLRNADRWIQSLL